MQPVIFNLEKRMSHVMLKQSSSTFVTAIITAVAVSNLKLLQSPL
jgi:hypothetical protein